MTPDVFIAAALRMWLDHVCDVHHYLTIKSHLNVTTCAIIWVVYGSYVQYICAFKPILLAVKYLFIPIHVVDEILAASSC